MPLHFQFPPTMNRPVPSETTRTVDGALLLPPALPLVPRLFVARTKAQLDPIDIVRLLALIVVVVVVVGDDVRVVGGAAVNMSALSVSPSFSFSLSTKARALFLCRRRAWWFSFGYVSIKYTQDDDDDVDSRCFFFSFFFSFSFLFFERERVLFSCGTEKKTVERERRERETRRDCLISSFFFFG